MTRFIADKYYAVPTYFDPRFALSIENPFDDDAPDRSILLFHPQVNFGFGLIINDFVAKALKVDVGDYLQLKLVGRSGGVFKLPNWQIGAKAPFSPHAPFLSVSADLLKLHFDFDPDDPDPGYHFVSTEVNGNAGTCSLPKASFP